jgi:sugar phosphate isomerase/epimerase
MEDGYKGRKTDAPTGRPRGTEAMQHALSTHLLVNHRLNTVWMEKIREAGIPSIEIFCARQHFDYRNQEQVNELAYWFRDAELQLHALHSPMFSDDCWGRTGPSAVVTVTELSKPRRLACIDEIKRALEVAEKIPCRYLIQHLGVPGEEYDERKLEAAFTALEEVILFANNRGVKVLIENIPNRLSTAERLKYFQEITHLDLHYCFDVGHARMDGSVEASFQILKDRVRSTHVHDNDGEHDNHLFPLLASGGSVDWKQTMGLFKGRGDQFPLVLELRESPDFPNPIVAAREVFGQLEAL